MRVNKKMTGFVVVVILLGIAGVWLLKKNTSIQISEMKNVTWQIDNKTVSFQSPQIDGFKNMGGSASGDGISLTYIAEIEKTPGVEVDPMFATFLIKKVVQPIVLEGDVRKTNVYGFMFPVWNKELVGKEVIISNGADSFVLSLPDTMVMENSMLEEIYTTITNSFHI